MALTHVFVTFEFVPTFNEFDTRFREEWSELKNKCVSDSYRMWGDEALVPVWAQLAADSLSRGMELPVKTLRCLELMDLDGVVSTGDVDVLMPEDELYPLPVASIR